jgi:hypothetical protein
MKAEIDVEALEDNVRKTPLVPANNAVPTVANERTY